MPRPTRLVLVCLGLFLVLLPLGVAKPGMPPTLKADEPAYLLMALSLTRDGDLECGEEDIRRLIDGYSYLPTENLILMTRDGWQTAYFGKPFIYSLLAAPAAALFGANGMVAFNIALLIGMVWMGALYLGRFNRQPAAALFATAFFLLSPAFAYAFWIQPEVLNMFSVTACLFLAFRGEVPRTAATSRTGRLLTRLFPPRFDPLWSGAVLALAVYNKPVLAAAGLAALFALLRRRGWKAAAAWIAAAAISLGAIAAGSALLTGKPTPYLGVTRGGVKLEDPASFDEVMEPLRKFTRKNPGAVHSWKWIFRLPKVSVPELLENGGYFLWGRHTGLLLYMPFAALALILFPIHSGRSAARWILLASLAVVALFFLLWIPFNWHGGGGFVGNRYFVNVYPGFLFLVTRLRPFWLTVAGYGAAGLLLGPILFTPYGAAVPSPTLQAHARNFPFVHFPLELSVRATVPGYVNMNYGGVLFTGRSDQVRTIKKLPGTLWVQGGVRAEILLSSDRDLESMLFQVATLRPDNEIELRLAGAEETLRFEGAEGPEERTRIVELEPRAPDRELRRGAKRVRVYKLEVHPRSGRNPRNAKGIVIEPRFYLGASLTYLGTREQLQRQEHYRVSWHQAQVPERLTAGETARIPVRLRNRSRSPWSSVGPLPVKLSYHWRSRAGEMVVFDGERTPFAREIEPGKTVEMEMTLRAPAQPGRYRLQLDLVREGVAWFSERGATTLESEVEVVAPGATADSPGP